METLTRRRALALAPALAAAALSGGCALLPRAGPTTEQFEPTGEDGELEGLVAPLTAETAMAVAAATPALPGTPETFLQAGRIDPDALGVGDVLEITIWEAGANSLFQPERGGRTVLEAVAVESDGHVFVPFAGRVRASGATPATLRARIAGGLEAFSLDPQVSVRVIEPASRLVTLQGAVGRPGAYPLTRSAASLAPMLALAGGASLSPEQVEVSIRRDDAFARAMLEDVYADPALDVALRPGDVIVLSPLRERFIALGATSVQAEIVFPTRTLTLLEALGAARGLRDFDADPSGVFLLRREPRAFADALLEGPAPPGFETGPLRPVVYRLDLQAPESLFVAQAFRMRDGDAIFATNAPLTELRKLLQVFTSVLTPVQQTSTLAL